MAVITKTIGATGRDYPDIQAFFNAIPADLVAVSELWEGMIYPDEGNEIIATSAAFVLGSRTTSDSYYVRLRAAAGASIKDHASKLTNALRINAANGLLVRTASSSSTFNVFTIGCRFEIVGLQVQNLSTQAGGPFSAINSSALCWVRDCIVESNGPHAPLYGGASQSAFRTFNVLGITRARGAYCGGTATASWFKGTTFVAPAGTAQRPIVVDYNPQPIVKDCALFGFTLSPSAGGNFGAGSTNNATDLATLPSGMTGTTGLTYASQFESNDIVAGTHDFRVKVGSGLIGIGVADSDIAADIVGTTRASPPTVGAWDAPQGVSGTLNSTLAAATFVGSGTGALPPVTGGMSATLDAATFAGTGVGYQVGTIGALSVTLAAAVFTGAGAGVVAGTGVITTNALSSNAGTVLANAAGITAHVYEVVSGNKVVTLTGLTTNASGVLTLTNGAIQQGVTYRVVVVTGAGEGLQTYTAT